MKFASLGSGSKGNSYYVEEGQTRILLDAGLSARQTVLRLAEFAVDLHQLDGVVVTHEHSDHISGVRMLAKNYGLPIWANQRTVDELIRKTGWEGSYRIFRTGVDFRIGELSIHPFSVFHDAVDPVGLIIETPQFRFGLAEDLGYASLLVREVLRGCRVLLLETNHDETMLMNGPYPWAVKNRINSRLGHLSNRDAAELLEAVYHDGLEQVMLCHISEQNNDPALARDVIAQTLERLGANRTEVRAAEQNQASELIEVVLQRTREVESDSQLHAS